MRARVRRIAAAGATAAVAAGGAVLVGPAPADAQVEAYPNPVVGDFTGDGRDELFLYNQGATPDLMVSLGYDDGVATSQITEYRVDGWYNPVAGDFDGDGRDEILWYGFGVEEPDFLWEFGDDGQVTTTRLTINGQYEALAGDFDGNGVDDVFWYGRGRLPDNLWRFQPGGGHTSSAQAVNGYYESSVAGSFGGDATDDIFWQGWAPDLPDYLWDFTPGTTERTQRSYGVGLVYRTIAVDPWGAGPGEEDLFFYGPGTHPDYLWDFHAGELASSRRDPVNGDYSSQVAGDFFGDGSEDVLWFHDRLGDGAEAWDHFVEDGRLVRGRFHLPAGLLLEGSD